MTVTSHQHWNTGEFETLSSGVHEFPSTFQLPASIPSSHDDLHGYIRYTLTAVPAKKFDITRQKSRILVNELVRIDTPMLVNPRSLSNEKTIGCLCCITRLIVLLARGLSRAIQIQDSKDFAKSLLRFEIRVKI